MRLLILILGFCLIASCVFAGVEATIVSKDIDDNGNIRVWTQYKIDGVEVESRYPKIDGKSVYCTRYNAMNFYNMTDTQIKEKIVQDVDTHVGSLIQQKYIEINNQEILNKNLKTLINTTISKDTSLIQLDTNNDGIVDTNMTVKSDGTEVISIIP
jgi:hypothetical protein